MESHTGDDVSWVEARRKAAVVARTLADAPPAVRLSVAARMLAVARSIGMFWTKLGTRTGVADSGTVEEIDQFVLARKPATL